MSASNRALFLDRDGVLDELVFYQSSGEWEAPRSVAELAMIPGIAEPLRRFAADGWLLFIVTNQPSYAKGKVARQPLVDVHEVVLRNLADAGVPIADSYQCFHHPEAVIEELRVRCDCRKPGTLFLRTAAERYDVDLARSWMVGDQDSDLACGRAAGCRVALLAHHGSAHKRGAIEPDLRVATLEELANALIPTSSAPP
ncbi:MAG TPA: HAD-IIIA family hydrolase [Thermoanaerobaculia bacterium]|jgi:D-glycero-D-manno-heptose 1,7-bisphosphate phosphatase